jgi:hypothetical protein
MHCDAAVLLQRLDNAPGDLGELPGLRIINNQYALERTGG